MSFEQAIQIAEWPYWIDEEGTVYNKEGQIRKPSVSSKSGHLSIVLFKNGSYKTFKVHKLMAETYLGPKPFPGAMVRHMDNNPSNNHRTNLRWGTRSENEADRRQVRIKKMQERMEKARQWKGTHQ